MRRKSSLFDLDTCKASSPGQILSLSASYTNRLGQEALCNVLVFHAFHAVAPISQISTILQRFHGRPFY